MSRSKRSDIILEKFGSRAGMTEPGKQWVTAALDPFHDTPLQLCGIPDGSDGNSIVQLVKQTMTITAPVGITTGTWDCNIVDWPYVTQCILGGVNQNGTTVVTPGGSSGPDTSIANGVQTNQYWFSGSTGPTPNTTRLVPTGGVTVYSGPTGSQLGVSGQGYGLAQGTNLYGGSQMTLPLEFTSGKHRIIAKGFEVHNTTAQLYKGGSITCYRSPIPDDTQDSVGNFSCLTSAPAILPMYTTKTKVFAGPPESTAAALLLPQSKQWNAEDGVYMVSPLHCTDIPAYAGETKVPILNTFAYNNAVGIYGNPILYTTQPTALETGSSGLPLLAPNQINFGQYDIEGCYFTGLTPQTALTLNWNVYVERFPSGDNRQLEVLANPAPERDNPALDFYTHAARSLPVGVPVKENGLGDWFKDVISTASDFVAPVLSMIPHPVAQAFSTGIKGLNGIVNKPSGAESQPSAYQTTAQASAPLNDRGGTPYVPKFRGNTPRERVASRQRSAMAVAQARGFNRRREANIFNNGARRNLVVATRKKFMQPMAPRRRKGGVAFTV